MASVNAVTLTLRNISSQLHCRLTGTPLHKFGCIAAVANYNQIRTGKKKIAAQYKYRPNWYRTPKPGVQDEGLTVDNEKFVKQVVHDTYSGQNSLLHEDPWPRQEFMKNTRRCGVMAIKIGVFPQWTKEGKKFHTTLLQVIDNHVIRYIPPEEFVKSAAWKPWWGERFGAVLVGAMSCDPRQFPKSYVNLFSEAGVPPKRSVTRFCVTPNAALQPGTPLNVMHYRVGDYVDVQSRTIDHGFQGVVKRWGMKGMPASHGVTKSHRKMGSTGGGGAKAGIWKGKKMPGHMGNRLRILRGLKIWRINTKYNVLYVHGPCIPGNNHAIVKIYDTVLPLKKSTVDNHPPMPTWRVEDNKEGVEEEYFADDLHQMSDDSIVYQ